MNTPIQGPSFHCLLWSFTRLNAWLKKTKMRSRVSGQIHDSIFLNVHRSELQDVLTKAEQIMTKDVRDAWKWIIVPLEVEVEVGESNWYEKTPWTCVGGTWKSKQVA
jgi:DNA polymerase I-like protein with 3'-5' exonuclease and polymerase domains